MYQTEINKIIIHHSFSPDNVHGIDWEGIRRYHLSLGWDDIGYHYGVELIEGEYTVMRGRPDYIVGAHCKGHNTSSLGICAVGNYDVYTPSIKMLEVIAKLCCALIDKHPKISAIEPHNKYSTKTCPGLNFDMVLLNCLINKYKAGLPNGSTA